MAPVRASPPAIGTAVLACLLGALAACSSPPGDGAQVPTTGLTTGASTSTPSPVISSTTTTTTTVAITTAAPTTSAPATTVTTASPATTTAPVSYRFPTGDAGAYAPEHHDYPAADIFVGCGASVVAPIDGVVLEVRRDDAWSASTDNPATRGGRSVSLLGDDGVRYYFAHFDSIEPSLQPGSPVAAGDRLGAMGRTGRASACHLHFAISPPCPGKEWSVRRGVVAPWRHLDSWREGGQLSPVAEVAAWSAANPDACRAAMADVNAPSA